MAGKDLRENPFRDEIYEFLLTAGYVPSQAADYDYVHALDPAKLLDFLAATQPEGLARFQATYGAGFRERLIKLLHDKIKTMGLLATLNAPLEDYASGARFALVYFKPNLGDMTEAAALYEKNVFSVRREFAYQNKPDSLRVDLALFLNGIPIAMLELKKQTAGQKAGFEGANQFKTTRSPDELVFSFNQRTLVYFAMDEFEAYVSTRLDQQNTCFLPFNKGSADEGAGNPSVAGKHSTHYVWEEILQRELLLKILREFMFIDDSGTMIFPRYHQLDAVLKMEADVRGKGVGGRYLVWHSAGSGKTKTIAWIAKRLVNIPEINTVIVISDRNVIDSQLGNEITTLDGGKGVVKWIENSSDELLAALRAGRYIIVTTLQKFPYIIDQLKSQQNKKFAIIIDEAHSSTTGKTISKVAETLSGKSLQDSIMIDEAYEALEDGQEILLQQGGRIRSTTNVSYFAFTATPKTETVELFGTRNQAGKTYYHKYSMKQAIDEGFILNPLDCYTTYNQKFELRKKQDDGSEYDSGRAAAAILHHITSSEAVVRTKMEIALDDFVTKRLRWLGGKAKAMIITPSRKHAVCCKLAVDRYIERHGYPFKSVVAFTGTIELDGVKFTEETMNAQFPEKNNIRALIRNHDEVRIIIVADKLQTGFDEAKLSVLYVDKQLSSAVKAVQTLSRINRPSSGKRTFVLDFVNRTADIKAAFEQYYGGELYLPTESETDPNILFAKRDQLLAYQVFDATHADMAYALIQDSERHAGQLTALLAKIKQSFSQLPAKNQKVFVAEVGKFTKLFYYISTVYNVWDAEMKRWAVFLDVLYKVLHQKDADGPINAAELVELVLYSAEMATEDEKLLTDSTVYKLDKVSTTAGVREKNCAFLDEIIERINAKYGGFAAAQEELNSIIDTLSADKEMIGNVRDSSPSAYEAEAMDRIGKIFVDGMLSSEDDRAQFFAQVSNDPQMVKLLAQSVVQRIRDAGQVHY